MTSWSKRHREVAIVGIHTTQQALSIDRPVLSLCLEAVRGAVDDAGIDKRDIDGISGKWPGPGGTVMEPGSLDWATLLGIPLRWKNDSYPGGVPALLSATAAISAGLCETVLIVGGQSRTKVPGAAIAYTRPDNEFTVCYGSSTPSQFALVAQQWFRRFGGDPRKMAEIAASIRNMGAVREGAAMFGRGPYTAQDVLDSPLVVEPFHLLELCLASEGAVAVIVTSEERARDCRSLPVRVLGGGMEFRLQQYVEAPRYEDTHDLGADAMRRATAMAGVTRDDIDVFSLYDPNAWEIARQFEALGYCAEGEGLDFVVAHGIGAERGRLAVNTDGGLMSYGHLGISGPTLKIVEAVRQLRGTATSSQVADAKLALVTGAGAGAQYFNLAILGRPD